MNDSEFWTIIGLFDWDQTGDDDAVLKPAIECLSKKEVDEIFSFDNILAEKLFAIDTRDHCRACYLGELDPDNGDDYISPDDFLYCRCVVVANGRGLYEKVLNDPSEMPQNLEFEALLYVAQYAYELKTGEEYPHVTPVSFESFQNTEGWEPTPETRSGKYTGQGMPEANRRPT